MIMTRTARKSICLSRHSPWLAGWVGVMVLLLAVMGSRPAHAIIGPPSFSCSFTVSDIDFGNINVISGLTQTTTGVLNVKCQNGSANSWVTVCPSFGYGTGGPGAWNPRQMANSANATQKLNFNLYLPGTTTIWGSDYWGAPPPAPVLHFQLNNGGNGNWTYTIDAVVPAGQTTVPPGVYSSLFEGVDVRIEYVQGNWSQCLFVSGVATDTFQVSANVIAFCEVNATDLDFGTTGLLNNNVDAAGQVSVRCTNGTPYEVRLNGGLAGATSPDQRRMSNGSESIRYGIYRDSARTLGWGDASANAVSGVGTGNLQTYTTHGRVFAQTTPSPGTYTDTVVVTVVY